MVVRKRNRQSSRKRSENGLTTPKMLDSKTGLLKTKYLTKNHVGVVIPANNGKKYRVEWNGKTKTFRWVDAEKKYITSHGIYTYDQLKKLPFHIRLYLLLEIELHKMDIKYIKKVAKEMDLNFTLSKENLIKSILDVVNKINDIKFKNFALLLLMETMYPYIKNEIANILEIIRDDL